jgi:signal transduction histidine kinase/ligand-binding sensor domain-containing protein/DNA-binding response OmpR family regulator
MKTISTAVFFLFSFSQSSTSQSSNYKFDHVTKKGVMAAVGTVNYIYEDAAGFMWFGTSKGLQRYDGYQLKIYRNFPKDTANTVSRLVNTIYEDDRGNLWVGTNNQGLNLFNRKTEKFLSYCCAPGDSSGIPNKGILSIYQDKQGTLWFGVIEGGLYKYDYGSGKFSRFLIDTLTERSMKNNVWSILEDSYRKLWIATADGIYLFDREKEVFSRIRPVPAPPPGFGIYQFIMEDINGKIWIGSYWGIYVYDSFTDEWKHYMPDYPLSNKGLSSQYIVEMREYFTGNQHELWIATTWGLNKYDFSTGTFLHLFHDSNDPNSLRNDLSSGIYIDKEGLLWTASGGASKLDLHRNPFMHFTIKSWPDSLHDLSATSFYEDHYGYYWIGTYDDGLYEFNPSMDFIYNFKPTPPDLNRSDLGSRNNIVCIYEDSRQNLWVSTLRFSVNIFNRKRKIFEPVPFYFPEGFSEPYDVEEILEDHFGMIWFGANDGLLYVKQAEIGKVPVTVVSDPVLARDKILDIYEDSQKRLWVITLSHGIYCLTAGNRSAMTWINYPTSRFDHKGLKTGYARFIHEDIYGKIWFMAIEGLYYYNAEKDIITRHEHFNRVFPYQVFQFTGDIKGRLWLVCDRGLVRYNPYDTSLKAPRLYNSSDGMPFDEVHHAPLFWDSKGYLYASSWGGSGSGFFRFHPDSLKKDNLHLPPVVITDFYVRNKTFPLDTSITEIRFIKLKHNENFFSFEFAALDYFDPENNQYAYKMEGLDEDWNYSGNRRFANYTGVPPGDYIFRVRGSNNDGYWNEDGASVNLTILKPPWKTWWAETIYAIFILTVIISIIWYYLKRQQLRHALAIEHIQKEQLAEMDRMKSRFFTNISHEFRTPLTLILGPIEKLKANTSDRQCIDDLNVMQRNARRLQRLIDQLLSLSRIESGQMKLHARKENLTAFTKGYFQSFESAAKQKGVELIFNSDKTDLPVFIDRDKMEKILYNLFSNALKFTPEGGRIEVEVGQLDNWTIGKIKPELLNELSNCQLSNCPTTRSYYIRITDTGSGISPENLPHIFDRFYQVDDSDSRFQEGTGIGLALVKDLVELHHGKIEVESAPGSGTTFKIFILPGKDHLSPEDIMAEEAVKEIPETADGQFYNEGFQRKDEKTITGGVRGTKPLFLLVEDNGDMRYYIRNIIGDTYQMVEAGNGTEGWDSALKWIPDLVISDVMMPGMDGYELCRKLKTDERTCHIPVVLLTAKAAIEDKLEGLETGADEFITKPFQPAELMARIRNLIRQRQALREKYRKEFEHISLVPEQSMSSFDARFMEKARQVVAQNLSDPEFNINDFSSRMNMSRVQLHRKLHGLFNLSATEFIRVYRLNAAARLFESKAGNVAQIAYEVGFNNLSYFSKCFQKQFGVKPSEFLGRRA